MKKIVLIGTHKAAVEEMRQCLSPYFHVQLCSEDTGALEGMMKIVGPDLVIISLADAGETDESIVHLLSSRYGQIPVLAVSAEKESGTFVTYEKEGGQFEHLIAPAGPSAILEAVCRRLGLDAETVKEAARQKGPKKKRILVVDEDGTMLRTIKAMLEQDYEVAVAISGSQAMTSIGRKKPDLILLDYEMPVCDGRMTLEMIRADEDLQDIPVLFLTAVNDRENVEAVLKLKPAGYLLKPPVKGRLFEEIRRILDRI